jgi:hypothetical protein
MAPDTRTSARARANEETFAKANERIRLTAESYDFGESVPFLCECSEPTCFESVRLSLANYREARDGAGGFILVPGHEDPEVERIVARGDGYLVVEKSL